MSPPSLGVVILTHGASRQGLELAEELLSAGVPPQDIVIVHNPTKPDDPHLQPDDERVAALRMDRNVGYAGGMNAGIRHQLARGPSFVLTLTHEVRFRPGSLQLLLETATSRPEYGVLGPALWWQEKDRALSYGGRRRPRGGIEHIPERPETTNGVAPTDWIDGAAMLYRRDALERAGLLEECFFIYVEDAEICLRVARSGFKVGVVPDALVEAAPGGDTRPGAWLYLSTRNGLEYARRARGTRGVAWELVRRAKQSASLAAAWARSGTQPTRRERCRLELTATRRGVVDFFRRRWGPPPSALTGMGDLGGTGQGT